jgi:type IV pilus assembly protein PilY1
MRIENTKRIVCIALWLLASSSLLPVAPAAAQTDPDLREIIPYLMLVIDTSGSMERKVSCTCTTPGCTECLPDCNDSNVNARKNRWAVTLEALTGTFNNFSCEPLLRTSQNGMSYDLGYFLPYHQPWDCTSQAAGTPCSPFVTPTNATLSQSSNGILDTYATRVQFGLMTFDGWDTWVGEAPLVPQDQFMLPANLALSNGEQGLWSYGGGHSFHYPNCTNDYMMDTGVRSTAATEGSLVSMNACTGTGTPGSSSTCPSWCTQCTPTASQTVISDTIQRALLKTRPYGGTPIAASLDDLYYHLKHDVSDSFGSCRNRFALLMTDGYPDDDYRSFGCNCRWDDDKTKPLTYCGGGSNDPLQMHCPYPLPEEVASDLIHGRAADNDPAMLQQLFVVGLAIDDTNVLTKLDKIAHAGCPNATGCDTDNDGHEALFANDLNKLVQNLSTVIDNLIDPVSRSVPAFATGTTSSTDKTQYQFDTGFEVATQAGTPWTGLIERRKFTCDNVGTLTQATLAGRGVGQNGDRFEDVLNSAVGANRDLWTVVPTTASPDGQLYTGPSNAPCGTGGCSKVALNSSTVTPAYFGFGASDTSSRTNMVNWMYGINGSVRTTRRLGDIYHSSPVIVSAPQFDTADEAFNLFRQRPVVASRPLTVYVSSNDGILHAFSADTYTQPSTVGSASFAAGQEMWGFVPPLLLNDLSLNLNSHQFTMDGTPAVKNVYFNKVRGLDSTGQEYHTVLITGMREGGTSYIALDVTDPINPKFLWQFNDIINQTTGQPDPTGVSVMGRTFAQPAIAQAQFMINVGGTNTFKNGAVAILPGGVGDLGVVTGDCTNGVSHPAMRDSGSTAFKTFAPQDGAATATLSHRSDVRCWKDIGRALYFVDVETGQLIKKIHTDSANKLIFPSPLVSTPAVFEGDIGTLASRAFLTDADGVVWRIDMSAADPNPTDPMAGWTARPFHDIFWDRAPDQGELTYEPPMLSVDPEGRLVVIVGTGDNNNFVKPTVNNRVVSLTEVLATSVVNPSQATDYKASLNWELRVKPTNGLVASELVTGSMGLFNGSLFFGTFIAITGSNACDMGKGRIHAVNYVLHDSADTNATSPQTYGPLRIPAAELAGDSGGTSLINVSATNAVNNFMIMGLGVTQRPTCSQVDTTDFNVFSQSLPTVTSLAQPSIYLVAQASGDKSVNSLAQKYKGSALNSIELKLKKNATMSRVVSWATSVD